MTVEGLLLRAFALCVLLTAFLLGTILLIALSCFLTLCLFLTTLLLVAVLLITLSGRLSVLTSLLTILFTGSTSLTVTALRSCTTAGFLPSLIRRLCCA